MKRFTSTLVIAFVLLMEANAQISSPMQDPKNISFHSDGFIWIKDMPGEGKQTKDTFTDTPDSLLYELGLQEGIPSSMSCIIMNINGEDILFDAGLGAEISLLPDALNSLGKKMEDIKYIYLTHLHPDHIGGLVSHQDGGIRKAFPNAKLYVNQTEYDAWSTMPEDHSKLQKVILNLYENQIVTFNIGDTLPGDVITIAAYGHTPGHTVFQHDKTLVIGDLIHGLELQINHPEYCAFYDMDKKKAIESRKQILKYAKDNGLTITGMHLPYPGYVDFSK